MARLITGGSGLVGAELAHMLVARGEKVVVFDVAKSYRLDDIADRITFVRGDLGDWPEVFNAIKDNGITHIYHMGAMLTGDSEANPWGSFRSNVMGTYNVLEAARLLGVQKMMFTSSIGTFGETQEDVLSDVSLQRPRDFYGVGKLYCEGLGRMYRKKFGLDFRAVRYPSVVGPGVNTPGHWDAPMIQSLLLGRSFECHAPPDMSSAMLYYKDAARAADLILEPPFDSIKMIVYNIGGATASARDIERATARLNAGGSVSYSPPPGPLPLKPRVWDDSYARKEWGWTPQFSTIDKIVVDFAEALRKNPERYR